MEALPALLALCEGKPRSPVDCSHKGPVMRSFHDDVIKWKHFPRYWPFVREIHRSPVNSPHKGQWRGALMFTLICARIKGWVNNRETGDLRRNRAHYDVIVMFGVFYDINLNKLLNKVSGCRWFETTSRSSDVTVMDKKHVKILSANSVKNQYFSIK